MASRVLNMRGRRSEGVASPHTVVVAMLSAESGIAIRLHMPTMTKGAMWRGNKGRNARVAVAARKINRVQLMVRTRLG